MKTLHLRRHTLNTGGFVVAVGHGLAKAEGARTYLGLAPGQENMKFPGPRHFDRLFHGPLIRTLQTAYAFCEGLGYLPTLMPVVTGLGDDKLFGPTEMVTPEFREAQKSMSNLDALIASFSVQRVYDWGSAAGDAVAEQMLARMNDGEIAIGFFHSPTIELAARQLVPVDRLPDGWGNLKELDGLVLREDENGRRYVSEVIRAQRDKPAQA